MTTNLTRKLLWPTFPSLQRVHDAFCGQCSLLSRGCTMPMAMLVWALQHDRSMVTVTFLLFRYMLPNFNECWWDGIILEYLDLQFKFISMLELSNLKAIDVFSVCVIFMRFLCIRSYQLYPRVRKEIKTNTRLAYFWHRIIWLGYFILCLLMPTPSVPN